MGNVRQITSRTTQSDGECLVSHQAKVFKLFKLCEFSQSEMCFSNYSNSHILNMYPFLFWYPGYHPRQRPLSCPHPPGISSLPHHVAYCPAAIGRPVRGGSLSTGQGVAPLALPLGHLVAEPSRLLLPGLLLGEGERSQGGPEGGAGAGGGASQQLSGHAGSLSNRAGDGGVAVGERQPAGHRRWGRKMNRQEFIDQIIYQAEIQNFSLLQLL